MMAGFEEKVKTQQEVEQGTKLSDVRIPPTIRISQRQH